MTWYYANHGERTGPVDTERFAELAREGVIQDSTLVWHEGMSAWQTYGAYRGAAAPAAGFRYAGFWIRFVARLIDGVILAFAGFVIRAPLFFALRLENAGALFGPGFTPGFTPALLGVLVLTIAINTALGVAYEAYFVSTRGATPGKMVLGLKIVRAGGGSVSPGLAVGRYFAQFLSGVVLAIGYLMAAFDSEKRALHDHICGTRVIRVS